MQTLVLYAKTLYWTRTKLVQKQPLEVFYKNLFLEIFWQKSSILEVWLGSECAPGRST